MPIYGYRCKLCSHEFEITQSVHEEPINECPECRSEVAKIFYPVGISFKGSGFYVTDYKKNGTSVSDNGSEKTSSNGNGDKASKDTPGCSECTKSSSCEKTD